MSNALVKTHDRLVIENLNVSGMLANRRLARAISDAGWAEFARLLGYKQSWRDGTIMVADRWYPGRSGVHLRARALRGVKSAWMAPHCGHSLLDGSRQQRRED